MRSIKLFLSVVICVGLLGGVGFCIYNAVINQGYETTLSIDNKILDISDFVKDYERLAEGSSVNLPSSDEDLETLGISKQGHTFGGWYFDAAYVNKVKDNQIIKSKGVINLYLKWDKRDYKVQKIVIDDASSFDFTEVYNLEELKSFYNGNLDNYRPEIIQYEGSIELNSSPTNNRGYEYIWLKWTDENKCEVDENGVPVYYSKTFKVLDNCTFVCCKMPKKYTVKYLYKDENQNIVKVGENSLRFEEPQDKIKNIDNFTGVNRVGYSVGELKISHNGTLIDTDVDSYITDDMLDCLDSDGNLQCLITYVPNKHNIHILGYNVKDQNSIIATFENGLYDVDFNTGLVVPYYTRVLQYLEDIYALNLSKNYLVFKGFKFADNSPISADFTMPDNDLEIKAIYEIKDYKVDIIASLKKGLNQEFVKLNEPAQGSEQPTYIYNREFRGQDFISFEQAKNLGLNTENFMISDYEFDSYNVYTVDDEGTQTLAQADIQTNEELFNLPCLKNITNNVHIIINTKKSVFYVEYYSEYLNTDPDRIIGQKKCYARKLITFDGDENDSIANFDLWTVSSDVGKENEEFSVFGGWKLVNTEYFGTREYIDYGFAITRYDVMHQYSNDESILDDVRVDADWYNEDPSNWSFEEIAGTTDVRLILYNGNASKVAVPVSLVINSVRCQVKEIGSSTKSLIKKNSGVTKILIPSNVVVVNEKTFLDVDGIDIRFKEDNNNVQDLVIKAEAFGADETMLSSYGVKSVYLPKRLLTLEEGAFAGNKNVEDLKLNPENTNYVLRKPLNDEGSVIDDKSVVLYKVLKNGSNIATGLYDLIYYPASNTVSTFLIPEDVQTIQAYAFYGSSENNKSTVLREVILPQNNHLQAINNSAFKFCKNMDVIDLTYSSHITYLGNNIFESSFSEYQGSQLAKDLNSNTKFRYIGINVGSVSHMPTRTFYGTIFLMGINIVGQENIVSYEDYCFHSYGNIYLSATNYVNQSFRNVRTGAVQYVNEFFGQNFTIDASNNCLDNNENPVNFAILLREYMQNVVVYNSLEYFGFLGSSDDYTVLNIYTNTDRVVLTSASEYKTINTFAFYSGTLRSFDDFMIREFDALITNNEIRELIFENCLLTSYAFSKTNIVNMSLKLIDCDREGYLAFDDTKLIYDADSCNMLDASIHKFNLEVLLTKNPGELSYIKSSRSFNKVTIAHGDMIIRANSGVSNATLGSKTMFNLVCESIIIDNIDVISKNAFSEEGQASDDQTCESIIFRNCDFSFIYTENGNQFRNEMFNSVKGLEYVSFENCGVNALYIANDIFIDKNSEAKTYSEWIASLYTADRFFDRSEMVDGALILHFYVV